MFLLGLLLIILVGSLYVGVGWGIAWILETAFSINVSYTVFMLVALIIYVIKLIAILIPKVWIHKQSKKFDREFESRWNKLNNF